MRERCVWSFLVLLSMSMAATAAGRPETPAPLILLQGNEVICERIEDIPFGPDVCAEGESRERTVSIFRNTRAFSLLTEDRFNVDDDTEPARSVLRDGFVTSRQLQALEDRLARLVITRRIGRCNPFTGPLGPNATFSSARYTIFWYGADGRKVTVPFGTEFPGRCAPDLLPFFNNLIQLGDAVRPR
jgi:hypothetical protein